jgi:hypothetical protein
MKKIILLLIIISVAILFATSCVESNSPPKIVDLIASAETVESEGTIMLSCEAQDPDGDPIMYRWSCVSGTFTSGTSSSTVMWKAPQTNSETISRVTVQIADADHPFDNPFMDSRAAIIMVDPIAERCVRENFGTIIVTNNTSFAIRVQCEREDPNCPECVGIEHTAVVALAVGQSTTFEMKPGNIISCAISETDWQKQQGGPWTCTVPFPMAQCETKTSTWINSGGKSTEINFEIIK